MPGSQAAAVPLCVVRAQCVLSAAVSNSQLARQQHACSLTTADGGELAASARVFCPFLFGEAAVRSKALPAAGSSFVCSAGNKEGDESKTLEPERSPKTKLLRIIQRLCDRLHLRVILEIISLHGGQ